MLEKSRLCKGTRKMSLPVFGPSPATKEDGRGNRNAVESVKTDPAFAIRRSGDRAAALLVGVGTPEILQAVPESGDGRLLPDQRVVPSK